uniref:Transposase (Putative), gypsy type n=1 Tax=Tanacetum cinerariifolium TaxID=118510 RepID=A0A699H0J8_TANCI|nr:hypothetical protein [Tanacetum cinerariifolium]
MDLLSFIRTADHTKVRIDERQCDEDEPKILETTVGRVVSLLPVAPNRSSGELEASVNKLFVKRGSGEQAEQGHSASGGKGAGIQPVSRTDEVVAEDVIPLQPRRRRKQKTAAVGAGEPSHPVKRLRDDHGTMGRTSVGGKSQSAVQRLLAGAVLNAEVWGGPIPTLPFVTSSVFATPEYSSHHSSANIVEAEVDSFARSSASVTTTAIAITSTVDPAAVTKEKIVEPSLFSLVLPLVMELILPWVVCTDLSSSDFLISGIRTVISPNTDLQKRYKCVRSIALEKRRRLQSVVKKKDTFVKVREKEIVDLRAQLLVKEAKAAEAICLRAEAFQFKEKSELDVKATDLAALVKVREQEVADLDAVVTSVKLQNGNLANQVHRLEISSVRIQEKVTAYENCMSQLEEFQDDRIKEMNDKFDKLDTDLVEMALHLEERFYPHLLTTISVHRWLLTHGLELAIAKCLNSTEYLSTLGAAIGKAVEKGMQDGLSAGITHGAEGRVLTDVAAYNSFVKADYLLLCNPHVDQLMVPIHHSSDQHVVGASALSFSLDVSSSRVQRIKKNIANHRSALRDVFVPLSEPLSITALTGTKSTLNVIPATVDTTTALSVTFVTASLIPPISTDDYEIAHAEGRESAGADVNPFPNVVTFLL